MPVFSVQGKYEEADALHVRAIGIAERAVGPEDQFVATLLVNRAALLQQQVRGRVHSSPATRSPPPPRYASARALGSTKRT